jgi:hypothetical protein
MGYLSPSAASNNSNNQQQIAKPRDDDDDERMKCVPGYLSPIEPRNSPSMGRNFVLFGPQHATSFGPPRQPTRQQSKTTIPYSFDDHHDGKLAKAKGKPMTNVQEHHHHNKNNENNERDSFQTPTTESTPCLSLHSPSLESEFIRGESTALKLTNDKIRAFLKDYSEDYDALRGEQPLAVWSCFAEKYYSTNYQFVRPSGNPCKVDDLVKTLAQDTKLRSIKMLSIDSIVILSSGTSAVVIYSCEHSFEYKGYPCEDRGVMTCVLDLQPTTGEIKVVQEHRSSGIPLPKETRWDPE